MTGSRGKNKFRDVKTIGKNQRKSYKKDGVKDIYFFKSGISGRLKFHVCVQKREWKNGGKDEQEFAGIITCA